MDVLQVPVIWSNVPFCEMRIYDWLWYVQYLKQVTQANLGFHLITKSVCSDIAFEFLRHGNISHAVVGTLQNRITGQSSKT